MIYYQYRADRARRTLRGIEQQVAKAEKAVEGKTEIKRNRFVKLSGGTRTVNRALEEKTKSLAGIKGYVTNLAACPDGTPITADFVISAYHRLSKSRSPSACQSTTSRPGRSTTTRESPSKRT
jgi:hypothetical protein